MADTHAQETSTRSYWIIWFILLALSVGMIALDQATAIGRTVLVLLLLGGMSIKAWLIASRYMHLRYEKKSLVLLVVLISVLAAAFMFGLMAVDGRWVYKLSH